MQEENQKKRLHRQKKLTQHKHIDNERLYTPTAPSNEPEGQEDEDTTTTTGGEDYGHDDTADATDGRGGSAYKKVVSLSLAGHTNWMEPVKSESSKPEDPLSPSIEQIVTRITRDIIKKDPTLEAAFQEYKTGLDHGGRQFIYTDILLEGFLEQLELNKPAEAERLRTAVSVEVSKPYRL